MKLCIISLLYAWNVMLIFCVVKFDEHELRGAVVEWNFKGNSDEYVSVCKDVRNPYWLVSWNSNNHSRSDRAEWIMSWGVAGGPSLWTWSNLRREGDLPWEWLGDNPLCPNSVEFRNLHRCKPPRAPMSLTQSGYRV